MNNLSKEKSPYLLQHVNNPVAWYPWSDEAFQRAKNEDKPIFLSIGYSTCHWCHVMAHESFEDEEVAKLLNDGFISIKLDREERPDIDSVYMAFVQMLTGSGGWPMTVFLTLDKKPFFGGTYFPKRSRFGRVGMMDLLPRIKDLWTNQRNRINESADSMVEALQSYSEIDGKAEIPESIFEQTYQELLATFDSKNGGFGARPKFPTPHKLSYLLNYSVSSEKENKDSKAREILETTLYKMRMGGLWDHVGFGFHRYSTDEKWLLPHFEKMLYDQALLMGVYADAYKLTKKELYKRTTEQIFEYLQRDMLLAKVSENFGAFYSAEDADSENQEGEKEEGAFYVWYLPELESLLSQDEISFLEKYYGIKSEGNFLEESTGELTGGNILHYCGNPEEEAEVNKRFSGIKGKLFPAREKRKRPSRDDKVLCDLNALIIKALVKAYRATSEGRYLVQAEKTTDFVLKKMKNKNGILMHCWKDKVYGSEAFLDDYAFLIDALLELFKATFNYAYLNKSIELQSALTQKFWDGKNKAFFSTSSKAEELIVRQKEFYDGAVPSGNSVCLGNLNNLFLLTGDFSYKTLFDELSQSFYPRVINSPSNFSHCISSLLQANHQSVQITILGDASSHKFKEAHKTLLGDPLSGLLLMGNSKELQFKDLETKVLEGKKSIEGKTTFYVCKNNVCSEPIFDLEALTQTLS
ncbi:MAG: thioredoxin domain-containing protein [Candidatus Caenarcaniphilales bacterium]|nr:thioredoxin domain-containing protein [Candidatus Caenarcaniphilales bacterium]